MIARAILGFVVGFGAVVTAWAQSQVTITRQDCATVVKHVPAPNVTYQPGRDVRGRPVAPADLGGGNQIELPREINIDIGFNLADKYGLGAGGVYKGESVLGRVTVRDDRIFFNGKPLDERDRHAIAEACRKVYGTR